MTINPNASEYKSRVGLDSIYVAPITQDNAAAYVAGTPLYLAPAVDATVKVNATRETQYADNYEFDSLESEGASDIEMSVTNLPPEIQAYINGDEFAAASGRHFDAADPANAPYFALGFRSKKSNGSYRYYWYLKGKFSKVDDEFSTEKDKMEPKTPKVKFTAFKTVHEFTVGSVTKRFKRVMGDEDTTNFSGTGWFTQVQTPAATSYSALALSSSVPDDEDTDVLVSANVTLTFNNPLQAGAINNVTLLDEDFAPVAAAVTLSPSRLVLTVNPTQNMAASTVHYVIISGVTDIYGQTVSEQVKFTTAT